MDSVLKKFSDVSHISSINIAKVQAENNDVITLEVLFLQLHYKDNYENKIKGHYVGSYEDVFMLHCQRVEELKKDVSHRTIILFLCFTYMDILLKISNFLFRNCINLITTIWSQSATFLKQ